MKVLVLSSTFPRWKDDSTPPFVYDLCARLQQSGLEIIVLAPHCHGATKFEYIDGLKVYRFPYFMPSKYQKLAYDGGIHSNIKRYKIARIQVPIFLASEFLYAAWLIKKENIQAIHSHWILPSGLIGGFFARLFGLKHITTAHAGDVFTFRKSRVLKKIASIALNSGDLITANSNYTKDVIISINKDVGKRIEIIPMGVDINRFNPSRRSDFKNRFGASHIILSVGRLVDKKGIEYLIKSMNKVSIIFPKAKLIIGGSGPERERLERLATELNLCDKILFAGRIDSSELPEYYASSDIFVLPSIETKSGDTEGLGVVLIEAMACGTPVIGSNIGGITDIIIDTKNGLLSRSADPDDIADKIIMILSDQNLGRELAEEGLKTINDKFSWDVVTNRFLEIF